MQNHLVYQYPNLNELLENDESENVEEIKDIEKLIQHYNIYFVNLRTPNCFDELTKLRNDDDILNIELKNQDYIQKLEQPLRD